VRVRAGTSRDVGLLITRLVTGGQVTLPVRIVHGREEGPVVWMNAATHGDEVVGVEVIREVLATLSPRTLRGTIIAVPILNVLGFMSGDRYLPDRRDLNRSFPGSARGSLASRLAHLFMEEVVSKCSVGIDLHTGADQRSNLPQIRADLDDAETVRLATAFGAPLMLHAKIRDGSLRHAAREAGAKVLLYEGGENKRFDDYAIEAGMLGVRRILAELGMTANNVPPPATEVRLARTSGWVRARRTGILRLDARLGQEVTDGERLGSLYNSFGRTLRAVYANRTGVVIGRTESPLVNRGDAIIHLAE
jgi:predicted deacylase